MSNKKIPVLVQNDIWLEGQTDAINERIERFDNSLAHINQQHGGLYDYSNGHLITGIHLDKTSNQWVIREWAPNAKGLQLVGDFNNWRGDEHALTKLQHGVWELKISGDKLKHGDKVKLRIHGADDSVRDRIPACITRAVQDEETHDYSAQIWQPEPYQWKHSYDPQTVKTPVIYEAHTGMSGEEPRLHTYREFADNIIPHIAKTGYNVVQLMAVQEHPYYGSFGYHVSNFFAACSRFGTPEDLKYLIDTAHSYNIAVLLDIVHSHAVKNIGEGLNHFDGTDHQYFHGGAKGDHPQWDSKCFNYEKPEVKQFLLSNVRYWLEEYHFDGFRFDGITSMLYEHHGTIAFDHFDKYFQDGVDKDAILYLQLATTLAREIKPGALIIAEDMSGMPGLCRPISEGGVGFTHRLAMGIPDYWIKLLKEKRDEEWNLHEIWGTLINRRHGEANIAYSESHDQALVGDKTLAFWLMDQHMYWHMGKDDEHPAIDRGMALHKIIRIMTLSLGGEGWLTFMGNEFGHPEWLDFPREGNDWSYQYCRRQWSLMHDEKLKYQFLSNFETALLKLTNDNSLLAAPQAQQLWCKDEDKVLAYQRGSLIFIYNLHPTESFTNYRIPVHQDGEFEIVLNSDQPEFGGHSRIDQSITHTAELSFEENALHLYLPSRTTIVLKKK